MADEAVTELAEQDAAKDELTGDPRLKSLDDAERYAVEATAQAEQAAEVHRAATVADDRAARQESAQGAANASRGDVLAAVAGLERTGTAAGIDTGAALAPLTLPDGPYSQPEVDRATRADGPG